ncbi:MAG TPA: Uma2 family endonuclease [Tepidisphaeraceae bacterium]|nr:Uma2 family endonuclease [Tepidisphaeraceae bacterium]
MTLLAAPPDILTLADLLDRLGGISADRVRYHPLPGTATEADVVDIERRENRLCELVDGVLVEKPMGLRESLVAATVSRALGNFVVPRKLGIVTGADGMMRLFPGLVRIPDVAFVSSSRLPGGHVPTEPIPDIVPDLAVEVLSQSNTRAEMDRKLREYFKAGVRVVWIIDLVARSAVVYSNPTQSVTLNGMERLDGGDVLPGFALPLADVFAQLDI